MVTQFTGIEARQVLRGNPLTELRDRVERGTYRVDSTAVAGSLLQKLVVVRRVRRQLEGEAGRSRAQIARPQ